MASQGRKRGNTSVRERPDSPEWDIGAQKTTCTRTFEGLYADLLTAMPGVGTDTEGYEGLYVDSIKIKKAISGKTTMTVVLATDTATVNGPPPDPNQAVYEIEWVQLEKPTEQHPLFKSLFPNPSGNGHWSNAQNTALSKFNAWENATSASDKVSKYKSLTPGFQLLAQKKMRGTTTYLMFGPVARITHSAYNVTAAASCGIVTDSVPGFPAATLPSGYKWLSTADRSTRTGTSGKWQRVQEWTGADNWDADLYDGGLAGDLSGSGGGDGGSGSGGDGSYGGSDIGSGGG